VLFLSLIFCKQEEKLLFFRSVSGCTCLILFWKGNWTIYSGKWYFYSHTCTEHTFWYNNAITSVYL